MEPVVAVITVGVIAVVCIVMLGWVQAYRTRKATRAALDRTISPVSDEHALGLITHQGLEERIREAKAQMAAEDKEA